jgi:hypothetical protein
MAAVKGLRTYKRGKMWLLLKIIDELLKDYGDEIQKRLF